MQQNILLIIIWANTKSVFYCQRFQGLLLILSRKRSKLNQYLWTVLYIYHQYHHKSCWQHRFPWLSPSICLNHISLLASPSNYIYIYIDTHKSVQKVLSFTWSLHLLHTFHLCMDLTCTEIKPEIWISFSRFIRNGSALPQQKRLAMVLLSWWGLELFEQHSYIIIIIIIITTLFKNCCICGQKTLYLGLSIYSKYNKKNKTTYCN